MFIQHIKKLLIESFNDFLFYYQLQSEVLFDMCDALTHLDDGKNKRKILAKISKFLWTFEA